LVLVLILTLIAGRSLYAPPWRVCWDLQNLVLDDVEPLEAIQ
jgi:hypothetical protein